jgi:hypothetical protein
MHARCHCIRDTVAVGARTCASTARQATSPAFWRNASQTLVQSHRAADDAADLNLEPYRVARMLSRRWSVRRRS